MSQFRFSGGVSINGNTATVNGQRYKLPRHSSMSIDSGGIYLDGKKWTPATTTTPEVVVKKEIVITGLVTDAYVVHAVDEVRVIPGEAFKATLNVSAQGTDRSVFDRIVINETKVDLTRLREALESTLVLEIPSDFLTAVVDGIVFNESEVDLTGAPEAIESTELEIRRLELRACGHLAFEHVHCPRLALIASVNDGMTLRNSNFASVTASTQSGDIVMDTCAITSECSMGTMSGDVEITGKVESRIRITTMSGDVHLEDFSGPGGSIATMSGDVRLHQGSAAIDALCVKTMSGDLSGTATSVVQFSTMSGDNRLKTKRQKA